MFIQNNEEESDIRWGHKEQNASSDQKKREKVEVHQQTANQHKFNRSQKNKEKVEDYPSLVVVAVFKAPSRVSVIDLHVRRTTDLHQGFPWLHPG